MVVLARHPSGGIRAYFHYVYGQPCMHDLELIFATPASSEMDAILIRLKNNRGHLKFGDSSASLFFTLVRILITRRFDLIHSHGLTAGILAWSLSYYGQ